MYEELLVGASWVALFALFGIVIPVGALGLFFYLFPQYMVRLLFMYNQYKSGMNIKYIGDEEFIYCYGEKNDPYKNKPSIVFIHGFSGSKDQYITCFKLLPKDLHLIALDMPGHGGTSMPSDDMVLNLDFLVERIHKFLLLMGFSEEKKVHLIGCSLGGATTGMYAATHPEMLARVSLVCPAMTTPVETDFVQDLKKAIELGAENLTTQDCPLLPDDVQGYRKMMELCCCNQTILQLHDKFYEGFLGVRLPKNDFYLRVLKNLGSQEHYDVLERNCHRILPPTQLVWGRDDQLINVSGAYVLKSKLANFARLDILEGCGHSTDLDDPEGFAGALLAFIREQEKVENKTENADKKME